MKSTHHSSKSAQIKSRFRVRFDGKSLAFAILGHVLLVIVAFFISFDYFKPVKKTDDFDSTAYSNSSGGRSGGAEFQIKNQRQVAIAPIPNLKRIFAEGVTAEFTIPEVPRSPSPTTKLESIQNSSLSNGLSGIGGGLGKALGNHFGNDLGKRIENDLRFEQIPGQVHKYCSKTERLQRLKEMGGTSACENAVVNGLKWLKANQNPDGSWGDDDEIKMTGLALLAYLGHCETQASEEFGESLIRGIFYLVNIGINNQGWLIDPNRKIIDSEAHAIGTYALGEALTSSKDLDSVVPFTTEITRKAANYIVNMQNRRGSWDDVYDKSTDLVNTSISGWQMQALNACRNIHNQPYLLVSVIDKALHCLNSCQDEAGRFGLKSTSISDCEYGSLTGVGMLCNQIWGREQSQEVRKAANYIYLNSKLEYNGPDLDLVCYYYESQAMIRIGGQYWNTYNQMIRDRLLSNQNRNGSWNTPLSQRKIAASDPCNMAERMRAKVYRTTLCILMLEVYYRDLTTSGELRIQNKPEI
jgi:hypothetical protein